METLIEELLTVAREGERIDDADVEAVDLAAAAERAWRTVETGGARLEPPEGVTVVADEGSLRQALENLFRNAVDHAGPEVTVTVGATPEGFFVADDGPGIPEDHREDVLELGFTTSREGTGFGLGIVDRVAEAHGWSVTVGESADGGARFAFGGVDREDD